MVGGTAALAAAEGTDAGAADAPLPAAGLLALLVFLNIAGIILCRKVVTHGQNSLCFSDPVPGRKVMAKPPCTG
tara:strand:- start:203 stop:424 length:222 start_codon:yes stop_codon:yes gene_type:complete